jgi:hypothetical protein
VIVLAAGNALQIFEIIVYCGGIDRTDAAGENLHKSAGIALDIANMVVASTTFAQMRQVFLKNFRVGCPVPYALPMIIEKIDRLLEGSIIDSFLELNKFAASSIHFQIQSLGGSLGQNVNATILFAQEIRPRTVPVQPGGCVFGKLLGLFQGAAPGCFAYAAFVIGDDVGIVGANLKFRPGCSAFFGFLHQDFDPVGGMENANRHRPDLFLGDELSFCSILGTIFHNFMGWGCRLNLRPSLF